MNIRWTDSKVEELKRCAIAGMKGPEIATALGGLEAGFTIDKVYEKLFALRLRLLSRIRRDEMLKKQEKADARLLTFLALCAVDKRAPSNPEIMEATGYKSASSASECLRRLEMRGLVKVWRGQNSRIIEIDGVFLKSRRPYLHEGRWQNENGRGRV